MRADARKVLGIVVWGAVILFTPILASAQSPQETLQQYVADIQKNPDDNALREKIIKLVLTMSPPPEIPVEAKKHISRGVAAIEGAKNPDDFKDACNEFQQVTMLAPWLGNGYRNLAIAQDKAGMYAAALQSLSLYLLTKPSSADVEWAEDLRNKVEYRKEKSAKESSPEAVAAQDQKTSGDWLKKLDSQRYTCPATDGISMVIDVRGNVFVLGAIYPPGLGYSPGYQERNGNSRFEIRGRESICPIPPPQDKVTPAWPVEYSFIISEGGDRITQRIRFNDGDMREYIHLWQR